MIELLTQDGLRPFLISGLLVTGFLLVEVVLMTLGLSSAGDTDGPDLDLGDAQADFAGMDAAAIAADMDIDLTTAAQIEAELASHGLSEGATDTASVPSGITSMPATILDLLGLRRLPLSMSLALLSASFAAVGLASQVLLEALTGGMLPTMIMVPCALVAAIILTRKGSRFIARIIPRDETSAISEKSLGRRKGVITVGTARAGLPAQVKVTDGFGNSHYLMLEPLSAEDEIPEGSEVLVLRLRGGELRLIQIG